MLTRLTHAAIAFAVTAVAYQIYVLVAVPLLEPPATLVQPAVLVDKNGEEELPPPIHKYRELLSAYFPADHWSLAQPPISFDTGQAMIVLSEYEPPENGRMRIKKCAFLFFPHERLPGQKPPRDAIVLEAPHGAELQFDSGFQAGLTGIGRIQYAKLVGEMVIRSDMREPGPDDDLLLRTRDLYMNQDLILTESDVDLRLGAHRGHGKELEMRLVPVERGKSAAIGLNIGGIDSLEVKQEVSAEIALAETALHEKTKPGEELPPIQVTSQGRFRYEFSSQVASFVDHVQLAQKFSDGKRNQLQCEALNLYFAGPEVTIAPEASNAENSTVTARTRSVLALRPGTIEAIGTDLRPVQFSAETHQAKAVCDSIWIDMRTKSVNFRSSDEVQLAFEGSEMRAPWVLYTMPDANLGQKVGRLKATGNGFIKAVPRGDNGPQQSFEVNWSDGMELARSHGKPVLTLRGRPRLQLAGGRLWADNMKVYLRERGQHELELDLLPTDVAPERMLAEGHVDIRSAELNGNIKRLQIDVQYLPSDLLLGTAGQANAKGPSLLAGGAAGSRTYNIDGDTLDVGIVVRDGKSQISSLDVGGQLEFREQSLPGRTTQPLIVRGEKLEVRNADTNAARISLIGSPASITAAGVSLETVKIQVNRGTSGAMVNSPGQLRVPIDRDLAGNLLAEPETLDITWQGGMNLENDRVTFQGDVVARTANGQLNTQRLVAVLSSAVTFDGTAHLEQAKLAQLECWEGVTAKVTQRDHVGLTALHRLKLESIQVNQINGKIAGDGPGWVESHHLSASDGNSPIQFPDVVPSTQFASAQVSSSGQHLRYLHIDFDTGIDGDLLQKRIAANGNVRAVYGPVDSWEQTLPVQISGTPAPDTLYIECQRLQVAESPNARLQSQSSSPAVELLAERDVILEGMSGSQGIFTARGNSASYDHQKSTFTLRWDGIHPATLTRQRYPGAPFDEQPFQIFTYNHKTDEVHIIGLGAGKVLLTPKQ